MLVRETLGIHQQLLLGVRNESGWVDKKRDTKKNFGC
jgi:hypothetical protein